MSKKATALFKVVIVLAAISSLSACDQDDDDDDGGPPPPARLEDSFGAGFGQAFRAGANTDPRDPAAGDINPVDPATDATAIP